MVYDVLVWNDDAIIYFFSVRQGAKEETENGLLIFVEQSDLKRTGKVRELFSWERLGMGSQPLENFANLNLPKAWILPFWCLKKNNLKGCGSENLLQYQMQTTTGATQKLIPSIKRNCSVHLYFTIK